MDDEVKTMQAGERVRFDCAFCNRHFELCYEPGMGAKDAPESDVFHCPFCGELSLCWDD